MRINRFLVAGALAMLIPAAMCSAADVDVAVDWETTNVTVSGNLGEDFKGVKLMMYCLKDGNLLSDIATETSTQQSTDKIAGIGYTVVEEDGEYEFPAIKVNGENGDYRFYVTAFTTNSVFQSDLIHVATKASLDQFVSDITNKTAEDIKTLLDNEVETKDLELEIPLYEALSDEAKVKASEALANKSYADITTVMANINKASVKPGIEYPSTGESLDKLLYPDKNSDMEEYAAMIKAENGMSQNMLLSTFKAMEKMDTNKRVAILSQAIGNTQNADLIDSINISVINNQIAGCSGYGDVTDIIKSHKDDVLTALSFNTYNQSQYRNVLNKELLTKSFISTTEMVQYITNYLATAGTVTPPSGGSSGGSSGGGSGSGNKKVQPTLIQGQTDAEPRKERLEEIHKFTDMEKFSWAEEAVSNLYNKGIISGKSTGLFAPQDNVTREEFVKMIVVAFNLHNSDAMSDFDDVARGAWYESYIASGVREGIINGVSDTQFGVGSLITRQDMAVIVARAKKADLADVQISGFTDDAEVSEYAAASVKWMKDNGLVSGYEDGSFGPKRFCTRAEAAKIIYEAIN